MVGGHHHTRTSIKGHSIRKVDNHCFGDMLTSQTSRGNSLITLIKAFLTNDPGLCQVNRANKENIIILGWNALGAIHIADPLKIYSFQSLNYLFCHVT